MSTPKAPRVSSSDREHMARVARQMRELDDEVAPASLREALERMDQILRRLGRWALPGVPGETQGDLYSHLAMSLGAKRRAGDVR